MTQCREDPGTGGRNDGAQLTESLAGHLMSPGPGWSLGGQPGKTINYSVITNNNI